MSLFDVSIVIGLLIVAFFLICLIFLICLMTRRKDAPFDSALKTLIRQGARWSVAAKQDQNPLIAVLHANYGAGYLWAIADIATSEDVKRATGVDYHEYKKAITSVQDGVTRRLANACPNFAPKDGFLESIV